MRKLTRKLTRREFLTVSTLTTGFAIAVQPVAASKIMTDARGLIAGSVAIPTPTGTIPTYRAMPDRGINFPIVVVIQEIFGVHAYIQDVCRRLAKLGYLAIAPELFYRQGDVSQLTDIPQIRKIVDQVPDAQVLTDIDAAIDWARRASGGDFRKLAVTGFCWGGRMTWLYAAHNPKVQAGVAWYGRLVGQTNELTPKHPIDIAEKLTVPVLGLYGGRDTGIPLDTVAQMRDRLKSSPSSSQIIVYPDAPHAFHADYRPSYRAQDAADGWQRLLTWLRQHGV